LTEPSLDAGDLRDTLLARAEIDSVQILNGAPALELNIAARSPSRAWALVLRWKPTRQRMPEVLLRDAADVGPLAHVSYPGKICHTDEEGLSVDPTRPIDVAVQCVLDALSTLEGTYKRHARGDHSEFDDEWEGYWGSLPELTLADLHMSLEGPAREVKAYSVSADGRRRCVGFTETDKSKVAYSPREQIKLASPTRALYVPLPHPIEPPTHTRPLTARLVAEWVAQAASSDAAAVTRILRSMPRRADHAFVLFSQPRPSTGERSIFAVGFFGKSAQHPLLQIDTSWRVVPIALQRHDRAYLTERGGAKNDLSARTVAVIGCGAVGSRVAEHLALAGVGRLIVVDPQVYTADNLFRHVLPSEALRMSKARAMKFWLERRLPGIEVQAEISALTQWPAPWATPALDGVVLALGDPYLERRISRQFHVLAPAGLPLVTCWMEPHGLGGHAAITVARQPGCLECLYSDYAGESRTAPKTTFVAAGQHIAKNLTGCGGAFTPYSGVDATQTALLASRAMINLLVGRGPPRYVSWVGNADDFRDAGFQTTAWFDAYTDSDAQQAAIEFSRCPCSVCGGT
jgi:hypothetical protein